LRHSQRLGEAAKNDNSAWEIAKRLNIERKKLALTSIYMTTVRPT